MEKKIQLHVVGDPTSSRGINGLSYEETAFIQKALRNFINGDFTMVADYHGSHPNNPERSQIWMKRDHQTVEEVTRILTSSPEDYDQLMDIVFTEAGDYWDFMNLKKAFDKKFSQVIDSLWNDQADYIKSNCYPDKPQNDE